MRQKTFRGCMVTLAVVLGVTGCGGSKGEPPTGPATPPATGPTAAPTAGSIAGITFYQPSHVISHTSRSALLTSPDSVPKVTAFYINEVDRGGWTTVSKSTTPYNGNLTIKKSGQGATILHCAVRIRQQHLHQRIPDGLNAEPGPGNTTRPKIGRTTQTP